MSSIELVAGGARGGKSGYALERAQSSAKTLTFVATAQVKADVEGGAEDAVGDGSMAERVERHQQERDERWSLIEEPRELARIVESAAADDCLLIDCLTLWVSNWLCFKEYADWQAEKAAFLKALKETDATVIMVTNEVGMGVIPMGELSRQFVDESGWLHQAIAEIADEVVLVMFGLPQKLKSTS